MAVRTGLQVLLDEKLDLVRGKRVGIVTNHSAVTQDLTHIADALMAAGVKVTALFGPEHGIRGEVADGVEVASGADSRTGVPVHSLYGPTKKPTPEMLADVDALVFDIQDVGARFYTFIYTMACAMEAAGEQDKRFIVLDRPNPITGAIEGNILRKEELSSFVGLYPIPIRHGLTIGELAELYRGEFGIEADLTVVRMEGWHRSMWYEETGLQWVMPSPNMPTVDTAVVFPGMCFIEGTNVSEGRGMGRPFETFGAPWVDAHRLADRLNAAGLPGVRFRPVHFVPTFSKHRDAPCAGAQVHVTDRHAFRPVLTGMAVIESLLGLFPNEFAFREPGPHGHSFFDLLAGTHAVREAFLAGQRARDIVASWKDELAVFDERRQPYLLYP